MGPHRRVTADEPEARKAGELIDRDELQAEANELQIPIVNVERDYVYGWILAGLYRDDSTRLNLSLKGGNALRKCYLRNSRFSDDIDLSSPGAVDGDEVLDRLNNACRYAESETGIRFHISRNRIVKHHEIEGKGVYKLAVYFQDFAGQTGHASVKVRVDATEFDRLQLPTVQRKLIHQYSDSSLCTAMVQTIALEEALADKLRCLLQRRYAYDLFDLVYGLFISRDLDIDRTLLLRTFLRKTVFGPNPIAAKQLLLTAPWDSVRGFWKHVIVPNASKIEFDQALESFRVGLDSLFSGARGNPRTLGAFFPEPIRSQIFHAGEQNLLMRISYKGYPRIVEPYSLQFKRRADGVAREYLYAFDRSGGSSGPGLKTFVASELRRADVLPQKFNPRTEISLTKGASDGGTFSRDGIGASIPSARSRAYAVKCNYCGRRFNRTTRTTKMRAHNDGYGNRCPGRSGYRV